MSVETYLKARKAFVDSSAEVQEIAARLTQVGSALSRRPSQFIFANQPIGLPMEASLSRRAISADAKDWPSVERIMTALQRWHQTAADLRNAWAAVSSDDKAGMKAPDDLFREY